jgi:hypothetical protein
MPNLPNKLVQPMKHMTIAAEAPALSATAQTHDEIYERMQQRLYYKTGLWFFSADTGLGKTTGFQIGMKKMWDSIDERLPFMVLAPTRHDAGVMFRSMAKVEKRYSESDVNYPWIVWIGEGVRVIGCRDEIQYIWQEWKGSRWRNKSYHIFWRSLASRYKGYHLPVMDPQSRFKRGEAGVAVSDDSTCQIEETTDLTKASEFEE